MVEGKPRSVDVVYIARGYNYGHSKFLRFVKSYEKYSSGLKHRLIIVTKGWDHDDIENMENIFKQEILKGVKRINLPDDGYDWGVYIRVSDYLMSKYVFLINSDSEILCDNWLSLLYGHTGKLVGAVGCTASWGSLRQIIKTVDINPHSLILFFPRLLISLYIYIRCFKWSTSFPNPHLRSNGILISTKLFKEFVSTKLIPKNKFETYRLESGKDGLSNWLVSKGYELLVIGSNGKSYISQEWDTSGTFRSLNQKKLILSDRQTKHYIASDTYSRRRMEVAAWGRPIFKKI